MLVVLFIPVLIFTYKKFRLSNLSYVLIFIFMVLHTIGSHYTYAEVPFGFWLGELFNSTRNHFDRLVHFSFGLLLAYPIREIFMRIANTKGFWNYWLPFEVTASFSCIYEIIEWLTAAVVAPAAGDAFLGSQGDIWDAQKDMVLAILGAAIAMIVVAYYNYRYNKKFGKEMKKSFSVKIKEPLGEVRLAEMKKEIVEENKSKETKAEKVKSRKKSSKKKSRVKKR